MPLFFFKEEDHFQMAVWKMEEDPDELMRIASLSANDIEKVSSFTHVARKKEWICIRMLLKKFNRNYSIGYHESGKPYLENSRAHLSISHTRDFAGIIVSDLFAVGIDLERIHPRIEKIAHKFVSDEEEKMMQGKYRLEKLFVTWGVKEVLFKMHSIGELIFKDHIRVMPFEFPGTGSVNALILKDGFQNEYSLRFTLENDLLMTWCIDQKASEL